MLGTIYDDPLLHAVESIDVITCELDNVMPFPILLKAAARSSGNILQGLPCWGR